MPSQSKNTRKYSVMTVAGILIAVVFFSSTQILEAAAPTVVTSPATNITKTNATLVGYISNDGGEVISATGFEFGLTVSYGQTISGNEEYLYIATITDGNGTAEDQVNNPRGVELDTSDNVFVTDTNNHRIQKFTSTGTFLTMFGWGVDTGAGALETCVSGCQAGTAGGDDGRLQSPFRLNFDSAGNIYVADNLNGRIQKFTSAGAYDSQFTGGGLFRVSDIDFDSSGNIYATEISGDTLYKFNSSGVLITNFGSLGSGNTQFNNPESIYIDDSDNIYIADSGNDRIQILDTAGNFVSRWGISGSDEGELSAPVGVSMNSDNELAVSNFTNSVVQKFTTSGTFISSVNTTGSGVLASPTSVDFDSGDNLYVANLGGDNVKKYRKSFTADLSAVVPSLTCGTTYHYRAYATNPSGTSYGADETFTTLDCDVPLVRTRGSSSVTTTTATVEGSHENIGALSVTTRGFNSGTSVAYGSTTSEAGDLFIDEFGGAGGGGGNGTFVALNSAGTDADGNIYTTDQFEDIIQKFNSSGVFVAQYNVSAPAVGGVTTPTYVRGAPDGKVYAVDYINSKIIRFSDNTFAGPTEFASGAGLTNPMDIAFDSVGNIYVADSTNNRIVKLDSTGAVLLEVGDGVGAGNGELTTPTSVGVDSSGNIYVLDSGNSRVQKFSSLGVYADKVGTSGSGDGQFTFSTYSSLVVDADDYIYVADTSNNRIQKFDSDLTYLSEFGSSGTGDGQFSGPMSISVGVDGDLVVSDSSNNRVQIFNEYFTTTLTGLTCGTTYHYRAYAINTDGSDTGDDATFTTSACPVVASGGGGGSSGTHFICTDPSAANYTEDIGDGRVNNDICKYKQANVPSAELACETPLYLTRPVKFGASNNPEDVRLLEKYLNTYENGNLTVDGFYSKADFDTVVKWQEKYSSEILTPWGITKGTGYVFITSLRKIKQIHESKCAEGKFVTASEACYLYDQVLKKGMNNNFVKFAQKALRASGNLAGTADGVFGPMTELAVKNFQAKNGLAGDGIIGHSTGNILSTVKCDI